ncbi:unnamed protein product [Allacma fusca]|uniref:Uncharacterized protein n=1 Tax=Allacma fusca TaxID=39272 RepID=A0A8J2JAW7_9HEXA|nr:unnamed protein product [Allacma fusca]
MPRKRSTCGREVLPWLTVTFSNELQSRLTDQMSKSDRPESLSRCPQVLEENKINSFLKAFVTTVWWSVIDVLVVDWEQLCIILIAHYTPNYGVAVIIRIRQLVHLGVVEVERGVFYSSVAAQLRTSNPSQVYEKPPRRDPPPQPPHCPPPSPHTSMFPLFKFLKDKMKDDKSGFK